MFRPGFTQAQAIQNKPNLAVKSAAKIYLVPRTTLRRRLNGTPSQPNTMPNSRKLTALEEEKLVKYILDLDSQSFPPQLSGVEEMANRLLDDRNASPLQTRFFRKYDCKRAQCEEPDAINAWFRLVVNTIAKYGIVGLDIYNFDETGFMLLLLLLLLLYLTLWRQGWNLCCRPPEGYVAWRAVG
ncbi:hypothetical protein CTA1_2249 [Colletotrichum tanaceti]|uniref:HTH psq-type domain-containing protein n=1 Tax=Colletotrichum tanaceti TaxID=1306861 RepID=A0A4U6XND7_9PEZI|nr:hypothetical protein CTA1_2249 [Colletotrichum tanaceti]